MKFRSPTLILPAAVLFLTPAAAWSSPHQQPAPVMPSSPSGSGTTLDIRDIREIIPAPEPNMVWWWIGIGVLLLVLAAILLLLLKKKRKKIQQEKAHEEALQALSEIRALMDPERSREYGVALADILRTYIEKRFQLPAGRLTTREFFSSLIDSKQIPAEIKQHETMLRDWLTHCDLVKFARYRLTFEEMEQMAASVARFVEDTRQEDAKK